MTAHLNVHLISDGSGSFLASAIAVIKSAFPNVSFVEYFWSMVQSESRINSIFKRISQPACVVYLFNDRSLSVLLQKLCHESCILSISIIEHLYEAISACTGVKPIPQKNNFAQSLFFDDAYLSKIDAMNYTMAHDDGQNISDISNSDIILVGVSRTSKSPTSMYLAYSGAYKVANIPFVYGIDFPDLLYSLKNILIVAFTINPRHLSRIRELRIKSIKTNFSTYTLYSDTNNVAREIIEANKVFKKNGWPVIDVTFRSVEEIAATVVDMYIKK